MSIKEIEDEITTLTNKLRSEKPEVYERLLENPQTIPDENNEEMLKALEKYRNNLKELLNK